MAVVGTTKKTLFGTKFDTGMTKNQKRLLKEAEASMNKNIASAKRETGKDSGKVNVFKKAAARDKVKLDKFKKQFGAVDPKSLKVSNKGMTPPRKLAKDESKVSQSNMMKSKAPASANPEVKKKKVRRNAAGTMGQMASGGKVKKMMGGGMAKKYKHGGSVKKCKVDGIARKGKTRAKRK